MQLHDNQGPGYADIEHGGNVEAHAQDVLPRGDRDKSREPRIQCLSSLRSPIPPTNNIQLSNTGVYICHLTS